MAIVPFRSFAPLPGLIIMVGKRPVPLGLVNVPRTFFPSWLNVISNDCWALLNFHVNKKRRKKQILLSFWLEVKGILKFIN